jgi:glutamate carboxypeptidase
MLTMFFNHTFRAAYISIASATIIACGLLSATQNAFAQADARITKLAAQQKEPLIATLNELVNIESGSGDREGLDKISALIADRLKALGGTVEFIEPMDAYRMMDTPEKIGRMVHARFMGKGTKKILLIAHMDTVYPRGRAGKQPFRVEGNRAYGLGIADDKQGVAVIIHVMAMLKAMNVDDYGLVTVLINGDEEISSPGSRTTITRMGAEHDVVMSFEGSRASSDQLSLSTAGIAGVSLKVKGRASHAGSSPERGRNALYELAHQLLQTRDLSNPATGQKLNWTVAHAGNSRNVIPAEADAMADVRVLRVADYDDIEKTLRERIKTQLIPETVVELTFERRRPPLEVSDAGRAFAKHAQSVYAELGKTLGVSEQAEGGGTDAAFASLNSKAPVVERFGLHGFGAHSNDAEYIAIDSIEPRLYLAVRLIMDVASGKFK